MKFVVLKFKHILQIDPWKFWFFSNEVPGGSTEQGRGKGGQIPVMGMAGGEGKQGGKGEGFTPHLMVVLARREVDGVGLSAVRGGARVRWPPVRGFWWLRVAVLVSLSTTSQQGARGRGRGRQCGAVEAAPRRA